MRKCCEKYTNLLITIMCALFTVRSDIRSAYINISINHPEPERGNSKQNGWKSILKSRKKFKSVKLQRQNNVVATSCRLTLSHFLSYIFSFYFTRADQTRFGPGFKTENRGFCSFFFKPEVQISAYFYYKTEIVN